MIINLQLADNLSVVEIDADMENIPVSNGDPPVRSQEHIYHLLSDRSGLPFN